MQSIRIYEIPDCKVVSSGIGMFGEETMERFMTWMSAQPHGIFPKDFLFWDSDGDKQGFHWVYLYEDGMFVPDHLRVIDFKGGLYAVATDIDQKTDVNAMDAEKDRFLSENGFERDPSRPELGNVITSESAQKILGYCQMDYYTPIKAK